MSLKGSFQQTIISMFEMIVVERDLARDGSLGMGLVIILDWGITKNKWAGLDALKRKCPTKKIMRPFDANLAEHQIFHKVKL